MNVCGCMITFTTYILYDIVITIHDSNYKSGLQISAKGKKYKWTRWAGPIFGGILEKWKQTKKPNIER